MNKSTNTGSNDWKSVLVLILIAWILYAGWTSLFKTTEPKPQFIRESFKNGKQIEVLVDDELTRDDWECSTGNCAGHEAGYDWAADQGITDPADCGGNSVSFIEGCETYANEQ